MPANTAAIFSLTPHVEGSPALIATAATVPYDVSGTIGTDIYKLFTAGANGSFVERIRFQYLANGTTTSVAAVMRIYISSVASGTCTNANTQFYESVVLPATGALNTTAINPMIDVPFNFPLAPNQTILAKISVSQSANTGWNSTTIAGDY